jgi:ribonuclease G
LPLQFFRRRRKATDELAPTEAAAPTLAGPEAPEAPPVVEPAEEAAADGDPATSTTAKKRRRGTRGGRGRKKPGEAGAATAEAAADPKPQRSAKADPNGRRTAAKPDAKPERKRTREREGRSQESQRQRPPRRTPTRRAPLPKAKRELVVSVDAGEKRVAMLEDGVVAEVYLERPEQRSIAGNVYLGTVDNVLPGMEAAFVEIGLEKNGFLYVDEIVGPELEGRRGARKIQDLIQRGQTILVQAVKDPMKTKGARLTTEISLPGRFVVYVPHGDGLGVSRRLDDDERTRLKAILKELAPKVGGVIVRTAAEGASAEDIERDLDFLQRLWKTIEARAKTAKAPSLIYQEAELPLRVTRDLFTGEFERLYVDHDRTYKRIVGYLKKTSPHMVERVTRYKDKAPLVEAFGVEQEIRSTLNRRVDLPSGGYLIFDYAEAFTVIDVNTGRFVGSRSKKSGGRLEDTITQNNLEAVKEVVRQLRLRDIGGIIVIDFIDMANPKNRGQVEDALRNELERDRTKTYVVEISPLGLVEMTRQNVTDGPREVMTRKCPSCGGDGIVVSEGTTAVEVERKLRALVTPGSRAKAYKVELNSRIAALVAGSGGVRLRELEELTKRRFILSGLGDVHLDHFRVVGQGTVEKLAPAAPVEVGQELDVKLVEVGLYDAGAGVGKVKGYDVCVGGAAKLVGKKVRARITAIVDGMAYAERIATADDGEPPITAEAEAERPTRPTRRTAAAKKPGEFSVDEEALEGDEEVEVELEDEEAPAEKKPAPRASKAAAEDGAAPAKKPASRPRKRKPTQPEGEAETSGHADAAEAVADGTAEAETDAAEADGTATAKKRTRRGSRGGRGRKRKPVTADADGGADAAAEDAEEAVAEDAVVEPEAEAGEAHVEPDEEHELSAPVIHLPDRDLGESEAEESSEDGAAAAAKKKTRRGARGGRNRKRKPATPGAAGAGDDEAAAVEEQAVPVGVVTEPSGEEAAAGSDNGSEPAEGGEENWEYTPMSEWDSLDDRKS